MATGAARASFVKWIICAVAAMGFLFDIYVVLVGPLIVQPALAELGGLNPGTAAYRSWAGRLFWIPPLGGGFCGFWGGYLTDRFGRRRVLTYSILIYTFSAMASGLASSLEMLLIFRTLCFAGVCVEFVAAVAWVAESLPEPKTREAALGYTQAFSSLGGVLAASAYYLASRYGHALPAVAGGHCAWRYTLIAGVAPALPLIAIRPFLPESEQWRQKCAAGTLKRPRVSELFLPEHRRTTVVTTLLLACAYGAAFGGIQQSPQITLGLPEVARMQPAARGEVVSSVQGVQEMGGLAGRVALAMLAVSIAGRRRLLRIFLVPGLVISPVVFIFAATHTLAALRIGVFFAGITTVAQLTFWGNYLPRVYPVHLRGTGEGFAANVGGRMAGTSAAYLVSHLAGWMPGANAGNKLAYAAAVVATSVYALALVLSFRLPEPPEKLPE